MCNQIEMYLEIAEYDRRAVSGEVSLRGVKAITLSVRVKAKIKKAILRKARGRGMKPLALLEWFEKQFRPHVTEGDVKECFAELTDAREVKLTSDRYIQAI